MLELSALVLIHVLCEGFWLGLFLQTKSRKGDTDFFLGGCSVQSRKKETTDWWIMKIGREVIKSIISIELF